MPTSRLKWIAIASAALLLIGVLIFCHSELRTSQWMVEAKINDYSDESGERWQKLIASIEQEHWLALRLLAPIGAGTLGGSLLVLAVATRSRFTLRTLLFAALYLAVIVGIPLGLVRPRLQNPRIWLRLENPDVAFGQRRSQAAALGKVAPLDVWTDWRVGGSSSTFSLVDRYTLLLTSIAFGFVPLLSFTAALIQRWGHSRPAVLRTDSDKAETWSQN